MVVAEEQLWRDEQLHARRADLDARDPVADRCHRQLASLGQTPELGGDKLLKLLGRQAPGSGGASAHHVIVVGPAASALAECGRVGAPLAVEQEANQRCLGPPGHPLTPRNPVFSEYGLGSIEQVLVDDGRMQSGVGLFAVDDLAAVMPVLQEVVERAS